MGSSHLIWTLIGVVLLWNSSGFSVDGTSDVGFFNGSCDIPAGEIHSWCRVGTKVMHKVSEVHVTNLNDLGNLPTLLNGVELRIGNILDDEGNSNPRCAILYDDPDCKTQSYWCGGMEGLYTTLYQTKPGLVKPETFCHITIWGVKVGTPAPSVPSISILGSRKNITLVGLRMGWSDALLYCRDMHYDLLSVMGPEDQKKIDELVADAPFPLTSYLWVGLRRSVRESSWYWMSGDPGNFTQWRERGTHSSPCGGVSAIEPSAKMPRDCGEHLNFFCFNGQTEGVKQLRFYSSTRDHRTRCIVKRNN